MGYLPPKETATHRCELPDLTGHTSGMRWQCDECDEIFEVVKAATTLGWELSWAGKDTTFPNNPIRYVLPVHITPKSASTPWWNRLIS